MQTESPIESPGHSESTGASYVRPPLVDLIRGARRTGVSVEEYAESCREAWATQWEQSDDDAVVELLTASWPTPKLEKNPTPQDDDDLLRNIEDTGATISPPHSKKAGASTQLPEDLWESHEVFRHIRQAAHSRRVSADAVLHSVLARIAAGVSHQWKIPPIAGSEASLGYFAILVGGSSSGKSSAWDVARELLPLPEYVRELPPGTGEGLVEALYGMGPDPAGGEKPVRQQVWHNLTVYVDEGKVLEEIGNRSGATILPTLRSMWSGKQVGATNASQDRIRNIPSGSYTLGLTMGIQPSLAGPLLADSAAGTPQRFTWALSVDPSIPDDRPEWPGPLSWSPPSAGLDEISYLISVDPSIWREVDERRVIQSRGKTLEVPLEDHEDLMRLKISSLLAIVTGRLRIDTKDWELSKVLFDTSIAVRDHVQAIVDAEKRATEEATSSRLARRKVHSTNAVATDLTEQVADRIIEILKDSEGQATYKKVQNRLSDRQRTVLEEAVVYLVGSDQVDEITESGQGQDKHLLRLAVVENEG